MPQAHRPAKEVDVAIVESRKHKLSARVDDLGAHAAHFFYGRIVPDGNDLRSMNGHGLGPWLLGVLRIDAAMRHDDVGWRDDEALAYSDAGNPKKKGERQKRELAAERFHQNAILFRAVHSKTSAAY